MRNKLIAIAVFLLVLWSGDIDGLLIATVVVCLPFWMAKRDVLKWGDGAWSL